MSTDRILFTLAAGAWFIGMHAGRLTGSLAVLLAAALVVAGTRRSAA